MNITVLNNTEVIKIGVLNKGNRQLSSQMNEENEQLRLKIEKQIAVAEWLKFIAQAIETVSTEQLYNLENINSETELEGKNNILSGLLIGTLGQFASAIGVTKELFTSDHVGVIKIHKNLLLSDYVQLFGSILEIIGTEKIIDTEIADALEESFIP